MTIHKYYPVEFRQSLVALNPFLHLDLSLNFCRAASIAAAISSRKNSTSATNQSLMFTSSFSDTRFRIRDTIQCWRDINDAARSEGRSHLSSNEGNDKTHRALPRQPRHRQANRVGRISHSLYYSQITDRLFENVRPAFLLCCDSRDSSVGG